MKNLVVVLAGGISGESEISKLTGKACIKALKKKYLNVNMKKKIDVDLNYVTSRGKWYNKY